MISDWGTAVVPLPPELKEVTVDPSTTALLFLDMMKAGGNARPTGRQAAVPSMKRLHRDEARACHKMVVWYSLVGANSKATPDDIVDPAIKPRDGEWYRQQGTDKFLGSTLEPILKQAVVKTVIICGNSFQGATVGTAQVAAQRGDKVIVPVDCSAGEDEGITSNTQPSIWPKAPKVGVTSNLTLTRSALIKY